MLRMSWIPARIVAYRGSNSVLSKVLMSLGSLAFQQLFAS